MTAASQTSAFSRARGGIVAALGLLLAACSSTPETRQVSLPQAAPAQTETQTASQRERLLILGTYGGVYDNPRMQVLIKKTVDRLVAASERPSLKYEVTVLNSPAINAFALPDGELFVTRGLVALANDTSELASVLSHEMGHVIARHAEIREDQARQAALISHVVSDVLSDPQTGALALAKSKLTLAAFSRAQEFEADGIGVGIAARAGFDPFGSARFLTDMQRNADLKATGSGQDPRAADFLATHPATPERVKNAQANARQFSGPGNGERDRAEYLGDLNGMVYGEDPSEGFARGRRFTHPKLGFTFLAPPGFTLDNTAQAVLGLKEGGDQALRLDVVQVPAEQSLGDYLKSGWIQHVEPGSIADFTVNGFPAASARATGDQWAFRLYAVRFGSDVYRFIFAAKRVTPDIDRSFRESIGTFRRMSLAESQQVHPLRIKIVTVGPNDTADSLAGRMATPGHRRERFLVLNGLGPHDQLKPGEKVKIVVE
ncbi:MAG: M48 family metalloprotease [Pseudolabrys sp.]